MARTSNKTLKYLIIACVLFFVVSISYEYFQYGSVFNNAEHYRKVYKTAIDLEGEDKYSEAVSALSKISPRYEAYDAVLFQQAELGAKMGNEQIVQKSLKSLINKYPQSLLYVQAKYDLGKSYVRANMKESAKVIFEDIIKSHPETPFELGSYYYLSSIVSKESPAESLKYKKKYISESFDGRFSQDCANSIIDSGEELTPADNYYLGRVFYASQKYSKAIEYLNRADMKQAWFYLAKAYYKDNNKNSARFILLEGIKKYPYSIKMDDLKSAIDLCISLSTSKIQAVNELLDSSNDKKDVEDILLYTKAQLVPKENVLEIYKLIVEKYPKGDYASESLWNLFWSVYKTDDYNAAAALANKHMENYPDAKAAPKMLFWAAKLAERSNQKDLAKKIYQRLMVKFPDDYYSFRANGRLKELKGGEDTGWAVDKNHVIEGKSYELKLPYTYIDIKNKYGATLAELLAISDFDTIALLNLDEPFLNSWIYYKKGLKTKAIIEARDAMDSISSKPDFKDEKWKFIYPIYFEEFINKYAQKNQLDPYIVISLLREESHFNNMALSSSNAVGLMQLLPSTAKYIGSLRHYTPVNEFLLFDVETNIKFGSAYLKHVQNKFDGKTVFAICAYNGGPGSVDSWLSKHSSDDIDEFIEKISYDETKNYVKKVYKSYWNYLNIYEEQSL